MFLLRFCVVLAGVLLGFCGGLAGVWLGFAWGVDYGVAGFCVCVCV